MAKKDNITDIEKKFSTITSNLDKLKSKIKFKINQCKKEGCDTEMGKAHMEDIKILKEKFNRLREKKKLLNDHITNHKKFTTELLDEENDNYDDEDPTEIEERKETQEKNINHFNNVIKLLKEIESLTNIAKKNTEKYYKENPYSYSTPYDCEEIVKVLLQIRQKLNNNSNKK